MTDLTGFPTAAPGARHGSLMAADARTKRRNAAEVRFRIYGLVAVVISLLALAMLLISIFGAGASAFRQTFLTMPVELTEAKLDKSGTRDLETMKKVTTVGYAAVLTAALEKAIAAQGISTEGLTKKEIGGLISQEAAAQLRNHVLANPDLVGQTIDYEVLANGRVDGYYEGRVSKASAALL